MVYSPDPTDDEKTILRQELSITVKGGLLSSKFENYLLRQFSSNPLDYRDSIEFVISKINQELKNSSPHTTAPRQNWHTKRSIGEITESALCSVDDISLVAKKSVDGFSDAAKKSIDDISCVAKKGIDTFTQPSEPMPRIWY